MNIVNFWSLITFYTTFPFGNRVWPNFLSPQMIISESYLNIDLPTRTLGISRAGIKSQKFNTSPDLLAEGWILFNFKEINLLVFQGIEYTSTISTVHATFVEIQKNLRVRYLFYNTYIFAMERIEGKMIAVNLTLYTGLNFIKKFKSLILKQKKEAIVRLIEVVDIFLNANSYIITVSIDKRSAVYKGLFFLC